MTAARFFPTENEKKKSDEIKSEAELSLFTLVGRDNTFVFCGLHEFPAYRRAATSDNEKSREQTVIYREIWNKRLFQMEIDTNKRVNHPAILKMIGTSQKESAFISQAIIYENAGTEGNLEKMLFNLDPELELRYSFSTRIGWINDAISAVKYLHQQKIVHGALHPENILFDRNSKEDEVHLKIANLHPARLDKEYLWTQRNGSTYYFDQNHWRWHAPEYESVLTIADYRTDIWLLGRLIAELALFRIPYANCYSEYHLDKVRQQELPFSIEELQNEIGPDFANMILRCCAINPDDRPTIEEVANTLWPKAWLELKKLAAKEDLVSFPLAQEFHLPHESIIRLQEKLELKSPQDAIQLYRDLSTLSSADSDNHRRLLTAAQKIGFVPSAQYKTELDSVNYLYAFWFLVARDGLTPASAREKLSDATKMRELATGIDERTLARIPDYNKEHIIKPEFCKLSLQAKMGIARCLARCPNLRDWGGSFRGENVSVLMTLVCDPKFNFDYIDVLQHIKLNGATYLKDIERITSELREKIGVKETKAEETVSIEFKM